MIVEVEGAVAMVGEAMVEKEEVVAMPVEEMEETTLLAAVLVAKPEVEQEEER